MKDETRKTREINAILKKYVGSMSLVHKKKKMLMSHNNFIFLILHKLIKY